MEPWYVGLFGVLRLRLAHDARQTSLRMTAFLLRERGLAGLGLHHQGVFGAEGDFGLGLGWCFGGVGEAEVLGQGGYREDALHPGERLADALAASSAEGEVGELVAGGFGFGEEAVGIKFEGVGVVLFGAAHHVLAEEEVGSGGDVVWTQLDGAGAHTAHGPGGWVETHGFGEDLFCVFEGGIVGQSGESSGFAFAQDLV